MTELSRVLGSASHARTAAYSAAAEALGSVRKNRQKMNFNPNWISLIGDAKVVIWPGPCERI